MNNSSPRSHHDIERPEKADALVAVVTSDRDLRRFLDDRIYRIPDRVIGRSLARDALESTRTLAPYQTGRITDGLPSAIEWWASVERVESVRRREIIPEEPGHPSAGELYHLLYLGSPHPLDAPLFSPHGRRILFLRTTHERLLGADDIADLPLTSAHADRLVDALATSLGGEVGESPHPFDPGRRTTVRIDDLVMEVVSRVERVECRFEKGGEGLLGVVRFSPVEVEENLEGCVGEILRHLSEGNKGSG